MEINSDTVYCYGLFAKHAMWRHFQVCKFKPDNGKAKPGKTRVSALCAFFEPVPEGLSRSYWEFLGVMNQDKIAEAVKQDPVLLKFGYRMFCKNETRVSQHQNIRQTLRELGRLLIGAREVTPVKTLRELIQPQNYDHAVSAARHISGYDRQKGSYECASIARKVGHSLHNVALFLKSEGLKNLDEKTVKASEDFAALYQESWRFDISSNALKQLQQAKWNAPLVLPLTKDVLTLHSFLAAKQEQCLKDLKTDSSCVGWRELAKVTLAQTILFNRRRSGEVSRIPLSRYQLRDITAQPEDVNLALTELEQKLCNYFVRFAIEGKRGRRVPVLLTPMMKESLDLLILKRDECGVPSTNPYLFALPGSSKCLIGSACLREFAQHADVANPKALTSTNLRKHIATLSAVLNLQDTEMDQLADFLGHDIRVHRKFYRLPEGTLQVAKISKILMALEQGRLGQFKGKSLKDIEILPDGTVVSTYNNVL